MNSLAFENKKEVKKSTTRKKLELRDFLIPSNMADLQVRGYTPMIKLQLLLDLSD